VRAGRIDLKGALRVAVFVFAARMVMWLFLTHHVADFGEVDLFIAGLQAALYWTAMAGFMYLAFEPYLRRSAPERIIAWTRLMSGDWRDPLVGRDILIGGAAGLTYAVLAVTVEILIPYLLGKPAPFLHILSGVGPGSGIFVGIIGFPAMLLDKTTESLIGAFRLAFLILFAGLLLRRKWLGAAVIWLVLVGLFAPLTFSESVIEGVAAVLFVTVGVFIAARYGVLATISWLVFMDIMNRPVTTALSAWYASEFVLYALVLIGLAIFGFYTSTAGQKLWQGKILGDGG
jgi:serine/threonine-protein kinase